MAYNRKVTILQMDRWYDTTSTGTLRLKRVSAANERKFPRVWREILQHHGAARLVRAIRDNYKLSLTDTWKFIKAMVNFPPKL